MGVKRENLVGNTYGYLTVVQMLNTKKSKCLCICSCQNPKCLKQIIKRACDLKNGCIACKAYNTLKHGDCVNGKKNYIWMLWHRIKNKCYNQNVSGYKNYGGRGIKMFGPWINDYVEFKNWILENLGERPTNKHSLDRIDVNGDYIPGNLRWATSYEQAQNTRVSTNENIVKSLFIDYHKNQNRIADLCKKYNLPKTTISDIVNKKRWKTFTDTLDI